MSDYSIPVNMNWVHVTERLAREFRLQGCFVLDPTRGEWVGSQPPRAFREYLTNLMATKDAAYFTEIRFYKYNEEGNKDTRPNERISYLALMPMKLKEVPYTFMGLLYESPEQLQELLRFRIMPNYTLFWVYQLVAEARVRNANDGGQKALVKALEEQRIYASRLESKVATLHDQIKEVKTSEMTLDQRVSRLTALLDEHLEELGLLRENYLKLYRSHENLQEDYLTTCVQLETRLAEMESHALLQELGKGEEEEHDDEDVPADEGQVKRKNANKVKALMERIKVSNEKLLGTRQEYERLKAGYGGLQPGQVQEMAALVEELQRRVGYYKDRTESQELQIKQLRAEAQSTRRGRKADSEGT